MLDYLESSCERHIELLRDALETSENQGPEIRGRIAAYRDVLAYRKLLLHKADSVIYQGTEA